MFSISSTATNAHNLACIVSIIEKGSSSTSSSYDSSSSSLTSTTFLGQEVYYHTITINHNLNEYSFFVTLIHEIAHLKTFNQYRNSVSPHGAEWKFSFKLLMNPFLTTENLPLDVLYALRKYMSNPAASSCSDLTLMRTLKLYDQKSETNPCILLEHLPQGTHFLYDGSRIFEKGDKLRKRFRCREISSGNIYLFSPLAEVEIFEKNS